ncbi:MAG: glycoside hydrolase family 10 protein [Verrucomicrobiota bacterium]
MKSLTRNHWWLSLIVSILFSAAASAATYQPSEIKPPAVDREFRGVWVATVSNIDWPSKKGLPSGEQQKELRALLDLAVKLNQNAVILQIRPMCDALYASKLEPWSEYLTGEMGKPPEPYYDPLEFAVEEAHKRGLELHAWFNPYRVRNTASPGVVSSTHISKTRPELVKRYGTYLWLDPSEPDVQDYSLKIIRDVVKRYDIDGVHIDDYFYPYRVKDAQGKLVEFPDDVSWARYQKTGGKLERDDWRRESVNIFVEKLYKMVKEEKSWVKFGISPFGIWRPGYPKEVKGLDAYKELYADSRKWLEEGWCDYYVPQLYWGVSETGQSYPLLLDWWVSVNKQKRHMWPGNNLDKIIDKWPLTDFQQQLELTRKQKGSTGNVMWHSKPLAANKGKVQELLTSKFYTDNALVPASPWLSQSTPPKPKLLVQNGNGNGAGEIEIQWSIEPGNPIQNWVLQVKRGNNWETHVYGSGTTRAKVKAIGGKGADAIALTAVNRFGNASAPMVFARQ